MPSTGAVTRRAVIAGLGLAAVSGAPASRADIPRSGRLHVPRYAPSLTAHERAVYISGGAPIGAESSEDHTYSRVLGLVERIDPDSLRQTFVANATL